MKRKLIQISSTSSSSYSPYTLEELDNFLEELNDSKYFIGRGEIRQCIHFLRDVFIRLERLERKKLQCKKSQDKDAGN